MNSLDELDRWLRETATISSDVPTVAADEMHARVLRSTRPMERGVARFIVIYSVAAFLSCLMLMVTWKLPITWIIGSFVGSMVATWVGYRFARWTRGA